MDNSTDLSKITFFLIMFNLLKLLDSFLYKKVILFYASISCYYKKKFDN